MENPLAVIDACCAINLLATGREVEIVRANGMTLLRSDRVRAETINLWTPPDERGQRRKEHASNARLQDAGLLATREMDTDELIDAFVTAAERIKDADASCIALAGVLKLPLITDDAKERRIARQLFPTVELVSTLHLVHEAARILSWSDCDSVEVARSLWWRGNFAPPRDDPYRSWYIELLASGGIVCP